MNDQDSSEPVQSSFFDLVDGQGIDNKDTPHPLIVAQRWGFELAYFEGDGKPKNYLYHAVQWTTGLGAKTRATWQDIKRELYDSGIQLKIQTMPYTSTDGKIYQVDFISQEVCYLVAQEMRVTKTRLQLAEIKEYLAKAGVIVDNIRRGDPETTEWVKARLHGVEVRKRTVAIYTATHYIHKPKIGILTNATYHYLFETRKQETATKEIVSVLELTKPQARNLRNHLHRLALIAIDSAEALASEKMLLERRQLNDAEQLSIVAKAARLEARSYKEKCDWLKIDRVTGQELPPPQATRRVTHYDYE